MLKNLLFAMITGLLLTGCAGMQEQSSNKSGPSAKTSPSDGYSLHVVAPHKMDDGSIGGPYHHYCKPHSPTIIQCLLYESTQANALLVGVEYFVAKSVARDAVSFETWNKFYHDHDVEIKTGRVQVLDLPPDEVKKVAAAAAQTDGIIFHLWPKDARAPTGVVGHPQSVGHKYRTE